MCWWWWLTFESHEKMIIVDAGSMFLRGRGLWLNVCRFAQHPRCNTNESNAPAVFSSFFHTSGGSLHI
jgi:hypothetical protein